MDTLFRDLRFALRKLSKSPLFTTVAVVSLAIGIGANTAVYSLTQAHFLRPPAGVARADAPGSSATASWSAWIVSPAKCWLCCGARCAPWTPKLR